MSQAVREKVEPKTKAPRKGVLVVREETSLYREAGIDPRRITATTIIGDKVKNSAGKELGKIEEVVMDLIDGSVSYIVLSVGGFAGIGDRFFAIPLTALAFDVKAREFYIDTDKKVLEKNRGFDKNNWPQEAQWPLNKQPGQHNE